MNTYGYVRVSFRDQNEDRQGRNYNEVIEQWQYLTRVKGVDIVVIKKLPDNFPPDL